MTPQQQKDMLRNEMDRQLVTNPMLRAGIAAIAMGESGFKMEAEIGYAHTSNDRIRLIFGARVSALTDSQLTGLKSNPENFFNRVYGGTWGLSNLGNKVSGDGYLYRGRGLFQLTGRANYERYAQMIGRQDIVTNPDLANDPAVACAIAVAYMRDRYKGGGWEGMKKAVGNNIPDIETTKDKLFEQYLKTGEFNTLTPVAVVAQPSKKTNVDCLKAIQQVLFDQNLYQGAIDGDFGKMSQAALSQLIVRAASEKSDGQSSPT